MTLRDLTPRQSYNLQRRCRKLFREWVSRPLTTPEPEKVWNAAYSAGLKDGLAVERKP